MIKLRGTTLSSSFKVGAITFRGSLDEGPSSDAPGWRSADAPGWLLADAHKTVRPPGRLLADAPNAPKVPPGPSCRLLSSRGGRGGGGGGGGLGGESFGGSPRRLRPEFHGPSSAWERRQGPLGLASGYWSKAGPFSISICCAAWRLN